MKRYFWLPLLPVLLTGCEWLSALGPSKVEDPVMGDPPPRMRLSDNSDPHGRFGDGPQYRGNGEVQPVSALQSVPPSRQLTGAQIVATVDDASISASQILERYAGKLKQIKSQATAAELLEVRKMLIQRDLPMHVQRQLLVNAMKRTLPAKGREKLNELVEDAFAEEIARLKKALKVETKHEVKKKLSDEGTSLDNMRDAFANQQMAAYYFQTTTAKGKQIINRRRMLDYYEKHLKDYAIPAEVRWQEIQVSYEKHGGKDDAFAVVEQAVAKLKDGADFADVAKKHSDGISASRGGMWDWTQSGSLTDSKIEQALFNLPAGKISGVMNGKRSYRLLRVVDRHRAGWKRFADVQGDIKATLRKREKDLAAKRVIDRLVKDAVITTVFDDDPKFKPNWRMN